MFNNVTGQNKISWKNKRANNATLTVDGMGVAAKGQFPVVVYKVELRVKSFGCCRRQP